MNLIELSNPDNSDLIQVDPDFGAQLTRLVLNGQSLLKYPVKKDDPKKGYPSAFMFPFANRVKDGRFVFNSQSYSLEINDLESNNAIHGLIAFEKFEIVNQSENSVFLVYEYEGNKKGFPFQFKFGVEYVLEKGCLTVRIGVKNTGHKAMPASFGWQPYFSFDDEQIGKMSLELPSRKMIHLDERKLPSGMVTSCEKEEISLRNTLLDNVYEVADKSGFSKISLKCENKVLKIEQEVSEQSLNYFVLYTPPNRTCISIGPQTSNTDALNNLQGLITLEAGKSRSFEIRISF